jgi:hypothetical protein
VDAGVPRDTGNGKVQVGAKSSLHTARKDPPLSPERSCTQSLIGFPQRIIISFVQALDFAGVEALIPNLQPCAESFGRA